jgi:excisionase family DNA binding protein
LDDWLNLNEAAEKLGIKKITIYRWSKQGILPIYKLVNKSVVKKSDVDRLLNDIRPLHKKPEEDK